MKSRRHTLSVNVRFDKACTPEWARRQTSDCVYGDFYPTSYIETDPEKMTLGRFRPLPGLPLGAIKNLELALIYLEDGAPHSAMTNLVKALEKLAPNSKVLAESRWPIVTVQGIEED